MSGLSFDGLTPAELHAEAFKKYQADKKAKADKLKAEKAAQKAKAQEEAVMSTASDSIISVDLSPLSSDTPIIVTPSTPPPAAKASVVKSSAIKKAKLSSAEKPPTFAKELKELYPPQPAGGASKTVLRNLDVFQNDPKLFSLMCTVDAIHDFFKGMRISKPKASSASAAPAAPKEQKPKAAKEPTASKTSSKKATKKGGAFDEKTLDLLKENVKQEILTLAKKRLPFYFHMDDKSQCRDAAILSPLSEMETFLNQCFDSNSGMNLDSIEPTTISYLTKKMGLIEHEHTARFPEMLKSTFSVPSTANILTIRLSTDKSLDANTDTDDSSMEEDTAAATKSSQKSKKDDTEIEEMVKNGTNKNVAFKILKFFFGNQEDGGDEHYQKAATYTSLKSVDINHTKVGMVFDMTDGIIGQIFTDCEYTARVITPQVMMDSANTVTKKIGSGTNGLETDYMAPGENSSSSTFFDDSNMFTDGYIYADPPTNPAPGSVRVSCTPTKDGNPFGEGQDKFNFTYHYKKGEKTVDASLDKTAASGPSVNYIIELAYKMATGKKDYDSIVAKCLPIGPSLINEEILYDDQGRHNGLLYDIKRSGDYSASRSALLLSKNGQYPRMIFVTGDRLCAFTARLRGIHTILHSNATGKVTLFRADKNNMSKTWVRLEFMVRQHCNSILDMEPKLDMFKNYVDIFSQVHTWLQEAIRHTLTNVLIIKRKNLKLEHYLCMLRLADIIRYMDYMSPIIQSVGTQVDSLKSMFTTLKTDYKGSSGKKVKLPDSFILNMAPYVLSKDEIGKMKNKKITIPTGPYDELHAMVDRLQSNIDMTTSSSSSSIRNPHRSFNDLYAFLEDISNYWATVSKTHPHKFQTHAVIPVFGYEHTSTTGHCKLLHTKLDNIYLKLTGGAKKTPTTGINYYELINKDEQNEICYRSRLEAFEDTFYDTEFIPILSLFYLNRVPKGAIMKLSTFALDEYKANLVDPVVYLHDTNFAFDANPMMGDVDLYRDTPLNVYLPESAIAPTTSDMTNIDSNTSSKQAAAQPATSDTSPTTSNTPAMGNNPATDTDDDPIFVPTTELYHQNLEWGANDGIPFTPITELTQLVPSTDQEYTLLKPTGLIFTGDDSTLSKSSESSEPSEPSEPSESSNLEQENDSNNDNMLSGNVGLGSRSTTASPVPPHASSPMSGGANRIDDEQVDLLLTLCDRAAYFIKELFRDQFNNGGPVDFDVVNMNELPELINEDADLPDTADRKRYNHEKMAVAYHVNELSTYIREAWAEYCYFHDPTDETSKFLYKLFHFHFQGVHGDVRPLQVRLLFLLTFLYDVSQGLNHTPNRVKALPMYDNYFKTIMSRIPKGSDDKYILPDFRKIENWNWLHGALSHSMGFFQLPMHVETSPAVASLSDSSVAATASDSRASPVITPQPRQPESDEKEEAAKPADISDMKVEEVVQREEIVKSSNKMVETPHKKIVVQVMDEDEKEESPQLVDIPVKLKRSASAITKRTNAYTESDENKEEQHDEEKREDPQPTPIITGGRHTRYKRTKRVPIRRTKKQRGPKKVSLKKERHLRVKAL